jgi:very-short-patch-repair endonuclease
MTSWSLDPIRDGEGGFVPSKEFRRNLRRNQTDAEWKLWLAIKASKMGFRFARQYSVGPYIADFVCRSRKLIVELDGDSHLEKEESDRLRDLELNRLGYAVLRFTNDRVMDELDEVLGEICRACETRPCLRY